MVIEMDDVEWRPAHAVAALASLETVTARLRAVHDARAVFLDIYRVITQRVVTLLEMPGTSGFLEPEWLSGLTGRFAEDALVAVRASLTGDNTGSVAWHFASAYAADGRTLPCENAMLGVSAHVNHDLAFAVSDYLRARRRTLDAAQLERYQHDYFHVNQLLKDCVQECLCLLVERYHCPRTTLLVRPPGGRRLMGRVIMAVLVRWRARVWSEILTLLAAPDERELARIRSRIKRRAGHIAQAICARYLVMSAIRRTDTSKFRFRAEPVKEVLPSQFWFARLQDEAGANAASVSGSRFSSRPVRPV